MQQALKNLKILDLSMNLPGPYMTWLLASLGAEVIKIENPKAGDTLRYLGIDFNRFKVSPYFEAVNRNKKSLTINLKDEEGQQIFFRLLKNYDVVIEGFRPGTMARLGLGYEKLKKIQNKLIQVSMSGYGQKGHFNMRAGYDLSQLALSGVLSINGTKNGELAIPGIQIADIAGGSMMALAALLAAVIQRENTGKGQFIDAAIFDGTLSLTTMVSGAVASGLEKSIPGNMLLNGGSPCFNVYETKDNLHMVIAVGEPKFWVNFCSAVDRKDLYGKQFGGDNTRIELKKIFATRTQKEWVDFLSDKDTSCEPVLSLDEAINSKLAKDRGLISDDVSKWPMLRSPFKLSNSPISKESPAPTLGEHTKEILADIGYKKNEIFALSQNGIV